MCAYTRSYFEGSEKDAVGKSSFSVQASLYTVVRDVEVRLAASKMSKVIFSFLMWDVLSSSIAFQPKTSQLPTKIDTSETSAEVLRVADFLSSLLNNNAISQVGMSSLSKHDGAIMAFTGRSMVASCLVKVGIQFTPLNYCFQDAKLERWVRIYLTVPLNNTASKLMHMIQTI